MDHSISLGFRMCQYEYLSSFFKYWTLFLGFSSFFYCYKICISSKNALWFIISKRNIPRLFFTHLNVLSKHLFIKQGLLTKPISNVDAWTMVLFTFWRLVFYHTTYHKSEMEAFHLHLVVSPDQWNHPQRM